MGTNQREQLPGPDRFPAHEAGEGTAPTRVDAGQCRENDAGSGYRHHRPRFQILRAAASALSGGARHERRVCPVCRAGGVHCDAQGAYFILAARALGLDCGPMSGFDNEKVDQEFFPASLISSKTGGLVAAGAIKSNFLCNLGYGDTAKLHPRGPQLEFGEACQLL